MNEQKYIFCHIGWMSYYEGLHETYDKIVGGGKFVDKNEKGHEICNFLQCSNGYVYGYVETWKGENDTQINICNIGAREDQDTIDNITVVWTATDPKLKGRYVVGWYKGASVFRYRQHLEKPPSAQHKHDGITAFRIQAEGKNAVLLPIEKRNIKLGNGKGWPGTTLWWFPLKSQDVKPEIQKFMHLVKNTINGFSDDDVAELFSIRSSKTLTSTEKQSLVDARIGQGQFRKSLIEQWNGCAVFGCVTSELLRASHIKPWKISNDEERLDSDNGLLLFAGLDAAFDKGLISFDKNGKILISSMLSKQDQVVLGISNKTHLKTKPNKKQKNYLLYHNSKEFHDGSISIKVREAT